MLCLLRHCGALAAATIRGIDKVFEPRPMVLDLHSGMIIVKMTRRRRRREVSTAWYKDVSCRVVTLDNVLVMICMAM